MKHRDVIVMLSRLTTWRPHQFLEGMANGIEFQERDTFFRFDITTFGERLRNGTCIGCFATCFIAHQLDTPFSTFLKAVEENTFGEWDPRLMRIEDMINRVVCGQVNETFIYGSHPMNVDIHRYDHQIGIKSTKEDIRELANRMRIDGW